MAEAWQQMNVEQNQLELQLVWNKLHAHEAIGASRRAKERQKVELQHMQPEQHFTSLLLPDMVKASLSTLKADLDVYGEQLAALLSSLDAVGAVTGD
eukprot:3983053-Amphidinium_carterae.1